MQEARAKRTDGSRGSRVLGYKMGMRAYVAAVSIVLGCASSSGATGQSETPKAAPSSSVAEPAASAPSPVPTPTAAAEPEPPPSEPTPPPASKAEIAALRARFKACYLKGLQQDPSLTGSPSIKFAIDAEGKVTDAKVVCSKWPKEGTECIRKAIVAAQFEKGAPGSFTIGGPC